MEAKIYVISIQFPKDHCLVSQPKCRRQGISYECTTDSKEHEEIISGPEGK